MKNIYKTSVCAFFLAAVVLVPSLWAKDLNTILVLPFSVHSGENIDYVRQGIADMLASRISVNEKNRVVSKELTLEAMKNLAGKDLTTTDVSALGKKMNADFVVWGSITKIGGSLSIDAKLTDMAANKPAIGITAQCPSMDEVIPKITDLAQRIDSNIAGSAPASGASSAPAKEIAVLPAAKEAALPPTSQEIVAPRQPARQAAPQAAREAEIISGIKGSRKGTFTSAVNPDFINAVQPLDSKSFWKSQQLPYGIRGIDVGDVNGDGLNETVVLGPNDVSIYQKKGKGGEFKLLQHIPGESHAYYVAVDVADINRNGIKEIIVSSYTDAVVNSFVLEFKDGKFEIIAKDLRWFMRVIEDSTGDPILLGQRRGMESAFTTPIYELLWQNGEYREGQKMRIPQGLPVYGLTLAKITPGGEDKVITLNNDDYLCVYDQTDKPLSKVVIFGGSQELRWKSEDYFGGSNTFVEPINKALVVQGNAQEVNKTRYVNLRILTYDTNKNGTREIIIVKNNSSAGRMFEAVKLFTSAEIYNLEWDGMGMVENWRTKKITGYVSDYQFKDIDNDGENEIVLALQLSAGRSVVVAYDLKKE